MPLRLGLCRTCLAGGADRAWIAGRFAAACAAFGTPVTVEDGRLVVEAPL